MASDALGSELISRTVGYKLKAVDLSTVTPNLPQRIAIIGEVNTANQATYPTTPKQILSAKDAGDNYGYGSPIHIVSRILFPLFGDGVGGIPVVVYPQAEPGAAVAKEIELTVTGTATKTTTHTVKIGGRRGLDGESYNFTVTKDATATLIASEISDIISGVIGAPVTASSALGVVTFVSKWKGLTSDDITITVDTNDDDAGMTYASASSVSGAGSPTVTSSLTLFGNEWNTLVLNTYGVTSTDILDELEAFNGIPDPDSPTGRYAGQIFKPFVAISGSTNNQDSSLTGLRKDEVTIAIAAAPLSPALPMEAAANYTVLAARVYQDTPHLDISGRSLPDMPVPADGNIGSMKDYTFRDSIVKFGNSTVDLVNGKYEIQDFVTTYHPTGEAVPAYRYVRNLMIDYNVKFGYALLEGRYVVDKTIANDDDIVRVDGVIKPKIWKGILTEYADDLSKRALIVDAEFTKDSIVVNISSVNPDRFESLIRYKRSGFTRILPTTAEAGFNFGEL